jgi:predicted ATPase
MPPIRIAAATRAGVRVAGRQRERGRLRFAFHSAAAGSGSMMFIAGEAGVGKTSLVEDFLFEIGQTEGLCRIARCRCSGVLTGNPSYSPLLDAFHSFEGAPEYASDLPLFVRNLSQAVPLVLFVDDLHAMDTRTGKLLAGLCALVASQKILIIGAYRPMDLAAHHPLHWLKSELENAGWARELRLHSINSITTLSDGIGAGT